MTDLERKLAETLREQAGEVTPNLDAAWAEQQRRLRKPHRRRRAAVWLAPLAAVLVVLTSVLLATRLNTAPEPVRPANPANPGDRIVSLGPPTHIPLPELTSASSPVGLTDFVGQTDTWTSYAFTAARIADPDNRLFCVAAVPRGRNLDGTVPQYGTKSPSCVPVSVAEVRAGYVGEPGGPLPPGKAVYLAAGSRPDLQLFDERGDLSQAKVVGEQGEERVFLADVEPGWVPVRFRNGVPISQVLPASR
jgi:hypothetical protein